MQTEPMREKMFTLRLSEEEMARLDFLSKHFGLNAAGLIRMLLKEKERDIGAAPAVTPLKKKPAAKKKGA
jgi:hypothetical protein